MQEVRIKHACTLGREKKKKKCKVAPLHDIKTYGGVVV
jgi:hypothetical protein